MFTDKIDLIISNGVVTIGGNYPIPKDIGTVSWSWPDYQGQLQTKKLNNVLYFPDSTVNILSATALDDSSKDDDIILVQKKVNFLCLIAILGGTKIKQLTQKIVFQN